MTKYIEEQCSKCGGRGKCVNGAWLRHQREAARISLRSVAAALDFSPAYICDIEHNRRGTPAKVLAYYEAL